MEDSSRIISILAIGFISILVLLAINIYKVYQLKKENKKLKQNIKE